MSNLDAQYELMQKPSMLNSKQIMIGLVVFFGLGLIAIAIVVIVSLIPLFVENTATSSSLNQAKESDFITNTYISNLNISSIENTEVTNMASIARQLETNVGLSLNSVNVYSVQFSSDSRRRRRHDNEYKRIKCQSLQCNSQGIGQTFTEIFIKVKIVYPTSCAGVTSTSTSTSSTTKGNTVFEQQALSQTNIYRATRCVAALTFDANLTAIAQAYAQTLCNSNTFAHSGNTYQGNSLGENLWTTMSSSPININTINGSSPVDAWFNEISSYNWVSPGFSASTGHFTPLVWQSTTVFGIGICCITGNTKCIVVANYYPAGNFAGQFPQNVLQPPCSGK
ncbi:hypothetical protein I4U23_016879 [Adineta vaga]|nr:hypothetical protein I4U23_016879 [Adineta vaga]